MAQRKTVTALFCDVVGSTSLGETHDPETLRNVLDRYFEEARAVVERHGGSVEKFIGDAVVALFGVPVAHEDDALRALRAADELRTELGRLNEGFERVGIQLEVRMGVNTGEVVVDESREDGFRASGDTMNVAARLEQSAGAGEILIGSLTRELVGQAVDVEAVEPLEVKGKSRALDAYRLVGVLPDVEPYRREGDAPLVGRERELELLGGALREAREAGRCVACTVVGPPGVGKSRLVREFVTGVDDGWRVLVGRCPSYGEGVTFVPLAEAIEPVLADIAHDGLGAEQVEIALGLRTGSMSPEEAFSVLRTFLERLAASAPVVLVVDDLHWAEPRLLDFLEHLTAFSAEAPILLVCISRPELVDERPSWSAPRDNVRFVSVAPLADDESTELVTHLLSSRGLESAELTRVLEAADGNPLFLEQLLALNAELDADEPLLVPPTIAALLAARLDQLADNERRVLEAAAVEGRMFERAHVELLVDGEAEADVGAVLVALARRQFVRPARGRRVGAEAFAFAHGLVRDATYASMPKERRARMHVELAGIRAGEGAHDEIVGLHLADAARLRQELGYLDDETNELGGRAARHLRSGGERALAMGDDGAAAKLFERAVELVGVDDPDGRMAQFQLGRALAGSGRLERAESSLQEVVSSARASGDRALELRADLALSNLQAQTDATISMAELRDRAEATLHELEELEDESGLTLAWWLLHWTDFRAARYSRSIDAAERTVEHAVRARERREELRALGAIAIAARLGANPVPDGLAKCDEVVARADGARYVEAFAARSRGHLFAMLGDFGRGRAECDRAAEILGELGLPISALGVTVERATVELLAGDLEAAESVLRIASERFRELGDVGYLSWVDPSLARVLAVRGEASTALALARTARGAMQPDHAYGQIVSRLAEGTALASLERPNEARAVAIDALELVQATDAVDLHVEVLLLLAELVDEPDAVQHRSAALALCEAKGDVVSSERVRGLL